MNFVSIINDTIKVDIQSRHIDYDMVQHLNNASYLNYIEIARAEAFKALKVDIQKYTGVVATTTLNFMRPIRAGIPISIMMHITKIGNKSMDLAFYFVNSNNIEDFYANATMTQIIFDIKTQKPVQIIPELLYTMELLKDHEDNQAISIQEFHEKMPIFD